MRLSNAWTNLHGYDEVVPQSWHIQVNGNLPFLFLQKLKLIKVALKKWKKSFVNFDQLCNSTRDRDALTYIRRL
jgi:hypothetical protein